MVTPVADRTLKDFLLPFSRKSNLGDVSEEQIKSIEADQVGAKSCQKVVVEWNDGQNDYNLSVWYEDETHLPIQYELIRDGAIAKKGFYENVEVDEFNEDLFELPKDTTIQGLGISK
jgi:negative regulator of sigma E activity